jgi:hypothetical protein
MTSTHVLSLSRFHRAILSSPLKNPEVVDGNESLNQFRQLLKLSKRLFRTRFTISAMSLAMSSSKLRRFAWHLQGVSRVAQESMLLTPVGLARNMLTSWQEPTLKSGSSFQSAVCL